MKSCKSHDFVSKYATHTAQTNLYRQTNNASFKILLCCSEIWIFPHLIYLIFVYWSVSRRKEAFHKWCHSLSKKFYWRLLTTGNKTGFKIAVRAAFKQGFGYLKVSKKNRKNFLSNHIITSSSNLDDMLVIFTKNVNEALDDLAPYKTFTVRSQFKFGLTEETKELMSKRDNIRKNLCKASASEKPIMIKQYKKIYF